MLPHPEEVLIMADKYKSPELCNYYCSNQCPIGQQYVPEIKMKELPQIILETVASLNKMNKKQERLIEITADGIIDNDELDDFIYIQEELEKISVNVETLQLWSERMLASGAIDFIAGLLSGVCGKIGIPASIVPLIIVRLFSSSAATGLSLDIFKQFGTDSYTGLITSILMGCTETVFYTMSVYYMAARIKKTRWTLAGALIATAAGIAASVILARYC